MIRGRSLLRTLRCVLIENDDPTYDEAFRQKTLIDAAREIAGKRLIFALDADEAFSANWLSSEEWNSVCQSEVGTRFRLHWVSPFADLERCSVTGPKIYGFMDDGSDHEGSQIHSIRVPEKADAPLFQLDEIVLLHFDRLSVRRMAIKRAWYQCWELVNSSGLSTVDIVRGYYERKEFSRETSEVFQEQWYQAFSQLDIQLDNIDDSESTWWSMISLSCFNNMAPIIFETLPFGIFLGLKIAEGAGLDSRIAQDPRGFHHQLYHSWLTGDAALSSSDFRTLDRRALEAAVYLRLPRAINYETLFYCSKENPPSPMEVVRPSIIWQMSCRKRGIQ